MQKSIKQYLGVKFFPFVVERKSEERTVKNIKQTGIHVCVCVCENVCWNILKLIVINILFEVCNCLKDCINSSTSASKRFGNTWLSVVCFWSAPLYAYFEIVPFYTCPVIHYNLVTYLCILYTDTYTIHVHMVIESNDFQLCVWFKEVTMTKPMLFTTEIYSTNGMKKLELYLRFFGGN